MVRMGPSSTRTNGGLDRPGCGRFACTDATPPSAPACRPAPAGLPPGRHRRAARRRGRTSDRGPGRHRDPAAHPGHQADDQGGLRLSPLLAARFGDRRPAPLRARLDDRVLRARHQVDGRPRHGLGRLQGICRRRCGGRHQRGPRSRRPRGAHLPALRHRVGLPEDDRVPQQHDRPGSLHQGSARVDGCTARRTAPASTSSPSAPSRREPRSSSPSSPGSARR